MNDKDLLSMMMEDTADFRGDLLDRTLRVVRRKRRVRRAMQVLAAIALLGTALWWTLPRLAPMQAPASGLQVVSTRQTSVEIVTTGAAKIETVNDEELLEMIPGKTKLLVWHAPGQAELVVIGP
jgi:hypothetical protein